jgi:hypothetical protein
MMLSVKGQTNIWDGSHTPWTKGTGTQSNPYQIETAEQLAHLAYIVNNGMGAGSGRIVGANTYWILTTDIDLNGSDSFQWTPIGYYNSDADYYAFSGNLDGNGHTIANLFINTNTLQRIGLFGYTDGGSIKNVGIVGMSPVTGAIATQNAYAGGIVGYANNTVFDNCYNTGNISSSSSSLSSPSSYSGGIAGSMNTSTINNCYNTGNISSPSSSYSYSGGIAGSMATATINNCYNTGNISPSSSYYYYRYSGGIVGSGGSVTNSYYLNTCGGDNTYGGQSKTEAYMKTADMVDLLGSAFIQDIIPYQNQGYPILLGKLDTIKYHITLSVNDENMGSVTGGGDYIKDSIAIIKAIPNVEYGFLHWNDSNTDNPRTITVTQDTVFVATFVLGIPNTEIYVWDGTCSIWIKGRGTEYDPYLIEKPEHLCYLAFIVNNGIGTGVSGHTVGKDTYWKLMINIDLNGIQWSPIGNWVSGADYYNFGGHFDGNGHTISNLYINSNELERMGLFGSTDGGSISNLGIIGNSSIERTPPPSSVSMHSDPYEAGIVGYADNTPITNCYSTCNISSDRSSPSYLGGIAGRSTSTISYCYNTGNISASNVSPAYLGGIVGETTAAVNNCYNTGDISYTAGNFNNLYLGGITGSDSGDITDCYNTGNVSNISRGSYCYWGGIVGVYDNSTNKSIKNCYNIGNISNNQGAIVGLESQSQRQGGSAINCYYLNTCGGNNNLGGGVKDRSFYENG